MAALNNRKFGLDLARSIAIGLVLIAHFVHKQLDFLGFFGVELFFALSGFLIGQIIWKAYRHSHRYNYKHIFNFWQRRWWRTLPNYYFFLVVMVLASIFFAQVFGKLPNKLDLLSHLIFSQSLVNHDFGFFAVSWSLCIEEWFYLLFPLTLFGLSKVFVNKEVCFTLTLALFIFGCFVFKYVEYNQGSDLRQITFARLDAIAFGVGMSFINIQKKSIRILVFFCALLLIMTPIAWAYLDKLSILSSTQLPIFLTIVPLGFAGILPALELIKTPSNFTLKTVIEKTSIWSYSIYLCQPVILLMIYHYLEPIRNNAYGNLFSKVLAIFLTILISSLLYKYLEAPMMKLRPAELKGDEKQTKSNSRTLLN